MIGGDVCGWLIVLLLYAAALLGFGYLVAYCLLLAGGCFAVTWWFVWFALDCCCVIDFGCMLARLVGFGVLGFLVVYVLDCGLVVCC